MRNHSFKFKELLEDQELKKKISEEQLYTHYIRCFENVCSNLAKAENKMVYLQPDLETEYQALKIAGISIGENNYIYLSKVIRTLAIKNKTKEIRFWGKILGHKDYYVIQGISSNQYLPS